MASGFFLSFVFLQVFFTSFILLQHSFTENHGVVWKDLQTGFKNLILILNNFQSLQIFGFVSFDSNKKGEEGLI
jgi:hypothetical protein